MTPDMIMRKENQQLTNFMNEHVVLLGDSIIDNAPYVKEGHSVTDILLKKIPTSCTVTKLAIDGHTTIGALQQLDDLPVDVCTIIISVGGNDALGYAHRLFDECTSIGEAFNQFSEVVGRFRSDYSKVLEKALRFNTQVTVMTIYNNVPGLSAMEHTALALFNEVILNEAIRHKVDIIDLRSICSAPEDYARVSPIEPSEQGAHKISDAIMGSLGFVNQSEYKFISKVLA